MKLQIRNSICVYVLVLFAAARGGPAASEGLPSFGSIDPSSNGAWEAFRAAQPFQTQIIGLSLYSKTRPRTLIVSEPPPKVVWESLASHLKKFSRGCALKQWSIMSGGWVRDVVCTLKDDANETLPEHLAMLQRKIYGTTEGAGVVELPVPNRAMIAHSLDVRYNASDLYRWLKEGDQRFRTNPIGENVSLRDIFAGKSRGVFQNSDRTLVLWVFDRGVALDGSEGEFRRFAVSGDLVLGAVASSKTVMIVARGRIESLSHLPPLRSETALLLAGSSEEQLAQSYERNDILAGKGFDGIDRAPIFLSAQLVDTELGNLLNVTDQLLKGWSSAGSVNYVEFKYPKPRTYPFGATPVRQVETDKNRPYFLYNWNTDGAAYRQTINGMEVIVPQRTGALSVIYGDPLDRPRKLENAAYDYFATLGDTSLVRVAQYTLLYQIFRQFDVSAASPPISPRYNAFTSALNESTSRQLKFGQCFGSLIDSLVYIHLTWETNLCELAVRYLRSKLDPIVS